MRVQPITPLVYEVVEETTRETTVVDVLVGSFAIVGVLGAVAMLMGLSMAGLLILMRKRHGGNPAAGGGGTTRLGLDSIGRHATRR